MPVELCGCEGLQRQWKWLVLVERGKERREGEEEEGDDEDEE